MDIEIDIDPMGAPRQNHSDRWRKRPVVERYRAFKDELRLKCNVKGVNIGDTLSATFIIAIPTPPKYGKKREEILSRIGRPHQQKFDIDNIVKAILDALLPEDSHVHTLNVKKIWGEKGKIIFHL